MIANGYYDQDPNIFIKFGSLETKSIRSRESTRILVLNNRGIVEQDSYQSTSLLRRNLMEDYAEVQAVLNNESVPARDLFISTGEPAEYNRVLYSYAPITHYRRGHHRHGVFSTSLDGIEAVLADIRETITFFPVSSAWPLF